VIEGETYRLDLAYPHLRIAVEYDGEEWHDDPDQQEADRVRRAALARAGWGVIVVRKDDMSGAPLDRWVRRLPSAIQERRRPATPRYARGMDAGVHLRRRRT
jgi:very-short-patch-repair endonuclease